MSTKKSAREAKQPAVDHKSLVHVLEDCVLALESTGQSEQDIFSLVNMILRGFIRNGELTAEYIMLANKAIEFRRRAESGEPITILTDASGNPLQR
jgi:hypothetical protein